MILFPFLATFELIALLAIAVFIIPATVLFARRENGWSGFFFILLLGCVGVLAWSGLKETVTAAGVAGLSWKLAVYLGLYALAGFATGFIYWLSYVWNAKEVYERSLAADFDQSMYSAELKNLFLGRKIEELRTTTGQIHVHDSTMRGMAAYLEFEKELKVNDVLNTAYLKWARVKLNATKIFDDPSGMLAIPIKVNFADVTNDAAGAELYIAAIKRTLPPRFAVCKSFIVWAAFEWPITLIWLAYDRALRQLVDAIFTMFRGTFDKMSRTLFGEVQV